MKLSVIILNYNVRYFLELCLQSVQAALVDIDSEIIVVDNNSSDDSCEMLKTKFPNVSIIENHKNFGFAKGNNIGVSQAKGEFICILNPDTIIAEDTFYSILKFVEIKENFGIVGCRIKDGRGRFLPESKRNIPTPKVAFNKLFGNSEKYYANHIDESASDEVSVLVGAFMFLRRDVYNKVGGFDERYFMYGEDIDLSYTIKKAGYTNFYFGYTSIIHFKGESTLKDKDYLKRFYGAMAIFYEKHFSGGSIINNTVKLGTKFISNMKKLKVSQPPEPTEVVSFSDLPKELRSKFQVPFKRVYSFDEVPHNSRIILDAAEKSFKDIILTILKNSDKHNVSFRIRPKNCNFILGSDSNLIQGEVTHF